MNSMCSSTILWVPGPLGRVEGEISLNLNYLVNFKTLFVFSQMKDIKHIRRDFHSVPLVMPKGLGLGGAGRSKI